MHIFHHPAISPLPYPVSCVKEAATARTPVRADFVLQVASAHSIIASSRRGVIAQGQTVSATATVGLTRNLTSTLNIWGKLIIILTMYLGRVGPISLAIAFSTQKQKTNINSKDKNEKKQRLRVRTFQAQNPGR